MSFRFRLPVQAFTQLLATTFLRTTKSFKTYKKRNFWWTWCRRTEHMSLNFQDLEFLPTGINEGKYHFSVWCYILWILMRQICFRVFLMAAFDTFVALLISHSHYTSHLVAFKLHKAPCKQQAEANCMSPAGLPKMLVTRNYFGVPSPASGPALSIQTGDIIELICADIHSPWWQVRGHTIS